MDRPFNGKRPYQPVQIQLQAIHIFFFFFLYKYFVFFYNYYTDVRITEKKYKIAYISIHFIKLYLLFFSLQ